MNLYTEKQVKMAIQMADKYHYLLDNQEDGIIKSLTPIELPSDEEIEQIADACHPFAEQIGGDIYVAYCAFKQGLQLMRDKIQGGNQ